jgi:hypothetical protein
MQRRLQVKSTKRRRTPNQAESGAGLLDFETFVRAALATGKPPAKKKPPTRRRGRKN